MELECAFPVRCLQLRLEFISLQGVGYLVMSAAGYPGNQFTLTPSIS